MQKVLFHLCGYNCSICPINNFFFFQVVPPLSWLHQHKAVSSLADPVTHNLTQHMEPIINTSLCALGELKYHLVAVGSLHVRYGPGCFADKVEAK